MRAILGGSLMRVTAGVVLAAGLLSSGTAFGSGYSIHEQGAKAMSEAGAFTARADDPSALFFNPAGIIQLSGKRLSFGTTAIAIEKNTIVGPVPVVADIDQIEDWEDTYSFRPGYACSISKAHQVRFGAYLDSGPVPDDHVRPRLPDADRTSVQVGYGYTGKAGFTFDVAYQALFFDDRRAVGSPTSTSDPVQPGDYTNFAGLLGLNLGWRFGR